MTALFMGLGAGGCSGGSPAGSDLSIASLDLAMTPDLATPDLATPDLATPDLRPPPPTVIQPGPQDGKDTSWGTVFHGTGSPDEPDLDVGGWGDAYFDYFEFDLSTGPPAAQTQSAVLSLYFSVSVNDPELEVHRITQPWTERGVTSGNNPATVFYKPFGTRVVPAGTYSVDITDLYKGWKDGTYPNYGIKLVPRRNDQTNGLVAASENADPARRPRLTITRAP